MVMRAKTVLIAEIYLPSQYLQGDCDQGPAPFADGIQYEIETAPSDLWANNIYMGEPCDESERAWNNLIHPNRGHGVRLYREEAAKLDINKSILLQDNNFAVILTVHHNLHCLRRLRQSIFPEHYYANWTDEDREDDRHHQLHCLESLRSSMICQPDLAPLPYYWSGNVRHDMNASPQSKLPFKNWKFNWKGPVSIDKSESLGKTRRLTGLGQVIRTSVKHKSRARMFGRERMYKLVVLSRLSVALCLID
ncbi:hypothetical protein BofuT4_P044300.1 [Botrytis cinerea T4]|uniref:Tat pathway signal sequence protein n=1 Tax=Botryotinia fuckeliana (strain T4) TaxID=999810 RepID=G2XY75_BOTF4|nr:hypothetical protein BofuT4_P044300.1 [Botrytis cinerea T4]